jgi:1-acyl-sn-glycerol-3-phosphate acyltransferase
LDSVYGKPFSIYLNLGLSAHLEGFSMDLFKTPKLLFYNLMLATISRPVIRIFKLRGVGLENVPKKGPCVICANHSHLLDPFFIGALIGRPLFQMASNEFFRKPLLRRFMWAMGAFPRKKGVSDPKSIKYAIRLVKKGHPLIIYPEGGRNWDGETLPIIRSTAKLVKLLEVPLVTVVSKGNYLAWPRWASKRRKSTITVHFSKPMSFEKDSDDEEVVARIEKGIYNNDNYTEIGRIEGKDPARGLPRLLWRCPACRAIEGLAEKDGISIRCSSCGKEWEASLQCAMRERGSRTWRAIKEYADLMFRAEEIVPIPDPGCPGLAAGERVFLASRRVTLFHEPRFPKLERVGGGRLFLTDGRLVFVPGNGAEARSFRFDAILGRSTEKNTFFQIVLRDDIARFQMNEESCYKWEIVYDYVRNKAGYDVNEI